MILVAYASKHGSTAEVAERIAEVLQERGLATEVRAASTVSEVHDYDAVVLGAPIYMGRWHKDARSFLSRFGAAFRAVPLWIFALGPVKTDAESYVESRNQLQRSLEKFPELEPRAEKLFGGAIDPEKLRFPFDRMPAQDIRDWDEIEAWAVELARTLAPAAV